LRKKGDATRRPLASSRCDETSPSSGDFNGRHDDAGERACRAGAGGAPRAQSPCGCLERALEARRKQTSLTVFTTTLRTKALHGLNNTIDRRPNQSSCFGGLCVYADISFLSHLVQYMLLIGLKVVQERSRQQKIMESLLYEKI
jgi:hypothetical protein